VVRCRIDHPAVLEFNPVNRGLPLRHPDIPELVVLAVGTQHLTRLRHEVRYPDRPVPCLHERPAHQAMVFFSGVYVFGFKGIVG
jgi:hypothetical protein